MSMPPSRDFASPMDDTVTSILSPTLANGGSCAVTSTAALFCDRSSSLSMPSPRSTFFSDESASGDFFVSPVPWSPTTSP